MGITISQKRKKTLYNATVKEPSYALISDEEYPIATYVFCLICIFIYFLDIYTGYALTTAGIKDNTSVINYGSVYRLFTCTLLHANIVHLVSNLVFIYYYGKRTECYFGAKKFIMVLVASGFSGSLCSLAFTPNRSVGASGIAFGIVGALLSIRYMMNSDEKRRVTRGCVIVIVLNLVLGFFSSGVDNAAHIGGFIGGYLIGSALGAYIEPDRKDVKRAASIAYCIFNIILGVIACF